MSDSLKYEDKFVAFIDVLGFKELIEKSVAADRPKDIIDAIERLGSVADADGYRRYGPTMFPDGKKVDAGISFQLTQVSDCVIVSTEISPSGAVNIVDYCRLAAERLLFRENILSRGYLTMGKVYHHGNKLFGTAYQEAFQRERAAACVNFNGEKMGTPFIEISRSVISYMKDNCTRQEYDFLQRNTDVKNGCRVVSPYLQFRRRIGWATSGDKPLAEIISELDEIDASADKLIQDLRRFEPSHPSAKAKIDIAADEITAMRQEVEEAKKMTLMLRSSLR